MASDSAVIFLNNKLVKNRKLLDVIDEDLAKKSLELSQLISTIQAIDNKASPDYDLSNEVGCFNSSIYFFLFLFISLFIC